MDIRSRKSRAHRGMEVEFEPLHDRQKSEIPPKKYHERSALLLVLYLPLSSVPWSLNHLISKRPLTVSSYHIRHGFKDIVIEIIKKMSSGNQRLEVYRQSDYHPCFVSFDCSRCGCLQP
jgi:hypothetical protein